MVSALLCIPGVVEAHGYLKEPKSRQYYAHTDGLGEWQQRDGPLGVPRPEYNQNGVQAGGYVWGPCGMRDPGDFDRDYTNVSTIPSVTRIHGIRIFSNNTTRFL